MRCSARRSRLGIFFLISYVGFASVSFACPICDTETGRQVREGIFGADFGKNILLTLAPFPVLLGMISLFCKLASDKRIRRK